MNKPILIDAIYINMGGALMILNHFINRLVENKIYFYVLKDSRCPKYQSEDRIPGLCTLAPDRKYRNTYYKCHRDEFSSVICMGNVPPPIKLDVPVFTYIHNVSLLEIPKSFPLKWKISFWIKQKYIQFFAKYTDTWVVQTTHTANLVKKHLPCKNKEILIYPFFYIPANINHSPKNDRHDYVFIGDNTYAKGHIYLIEAWLKLHRIGFDKTLHLTVSDPDLCALIEKIRSEGVNIENHGKIPFNKVIELYNSSKATIYPSLNESLGLGIIEAIEAGCDVIGSDLPFIHSVCIPALTFKPQNADQIVDAVLMYEHNICNHTKLKISDMTDDFINDII